VLEVPHEGGGIEEVDGCDAQASLRGNTHTLLDYQSRAKDSRHGQAGSRDGVSGATTPLLDMGGRQG
jgi:hypothetical protein